MIRFAAVFHSASARLEATMTLRHVLSLGATVTVALILTTTGQAQQSPAASASEPRLVDIQGGQVRVVTVATGLVHPWSIAFLPDGHTMLVSEQSGRLRV